MLNLLIIRYSMDMEVLKLQLISERMFLDSFSRMLVSLKFQIWMKSCRRRLKLASEKHFFLLIELLLMIPVSVARPGRRP